MPTGLRPPRLVGTLCALAACVVLFAVAGCAGPRARAADNCPLTSLVLPPPPQPPVVAPEPSQLEPLMPEIISRSDWASSAPIASRLVPMDKITRITIHHEGMDPEEEAPISVVKDELIKIQKSHQERMHAGDIGYHFIIDSNGRIWEGRPLKFQGAHAGNNGANRGNIGIVLMGNFDIQRPKVAQLNSLRVLLTYLMDKYGVPVSSLYTHREVYKMYGLGTTDCPGRYLQREVDSMRTRLAEADAEKK